MDEETTIQVKVFDCGCVVKWDDATNDTEIEFCDMHSNIYLQRIEAKNAALRARVVELERLLAMAEEAAQDLAQSKSEGAGAWGSHTVSKFEKETETR